MHAAAGRAGRREQVRFVSASQFGAGAFLNAIPTRAHFRLPSYVLRFALQRRFGLHLSMMTDVMADGIYSQHGLPFDALGDVAQNDGAAGHQPDRGTSRRSSWTSSRCYENKYAVQCIA